MLRRSSLLALLTLALLAAPAHAGWFPADAVDGPSPDIVAVGDIDIARDGTGGLVYVKNEAGIPHVYLSRLVGGTWRAPERVDTGIIEPSGSPVIAAGENHRLAVAWLSGGKLHGSYFPGGTPNTPLTGPQLLHDGDSAAPHIDMSINGTAYVVFTAGGSDVRAVRLMRGSNAWEGVPSVLDIEPGQIAGAGAGRPRVAVSAEGNAVAVWGEDAGGRSRVYGRRITGLTLSVAPQEVSLPDFEGQAGGNADSADLDIEWDGSYAWAVFRQDFGTTSRAIARRLVGSLWESPVPVDGGGPANSPRIEINGRGAGIATAGNSASRAVHASLLELDAFGQSFQLGGSAVAPMPLAGASDRDDMMVAWRGTDGAGLPNVMARFRPEAKGYEPEVQISNPVFGPVDLEGGFEASQTRMGDYAVAFVQGTGADRRIVVGHYDRAPGMPYGITSTKYQRRSQPRLKWRGAAELWGPQQFRIFIDDVEVAQTTATSLIVPTPLADGLHRWHIVATDRRGQTTTSRTKRNLRVDSVAPTAKVRISGKRKRGQSLKISVSARDPKGGAGFSYTQIVFGDGAATYTSRRATTRVTHRYRRSGKLTLIAKVVDKAGNVTRQRVSLRIKK